MVVEQRMPLGNSSAFGGFIWSVKPNGQLSMEHAVLSAGVAEMFPAMWWWLCGPCSQSNLRAGRDHWRKASGAGFGLQKARGVNRHQQDLTEGLGSIPGEAFSIQASPVKLPHRSEVPDPTAHQFQTRMMVCACSRAAACDFPGQGEKTA